MYLELIMKDQLTQQATQTPSDEKKTGTPKIPLKTQFEQLQSSEQGLTGEEARRRLDKYGPNDTTGTKPEPGLLPLFRLFFNPFIFTPTHAIPLPPILTNP